MNGERTLPEQPSLRHLKLEAKRRLAAGEFSTLHGSQLAIAREHGQPSWTALKAAIDARGPADGRAVAQLRWIAARFGDAAEQGWTAPGDRELRGHFTDEFLAHVTPERLIAIFTAARSELREELVVVASTPFTAQCHIAGRLVAAVAEATPPYRLAGLQLRLLGERVSDSRTASPHTVTEGAAPDAVAGITADAISRLGVPGVGLAGRVRGEPGWAAATGWADLDRGDPLQPGHAFPAYGITTIVTAVAVLRLVADGRLGLDEAANRYLGAVRLADDEVTVRQLLSHAGGVTDPEPPPAPPVPAPPVPAPPVPDPAAFIGPVIPCAGKRGTYRFSAAGYAALGEIVSGLAGQAYPEAVSRLVLQPLAMTASWFPAGWPTPGRAPAPIVTCYDVGAAGVFDAVPGSAPAVVAAGGLWSTASDVARLGLEWRSLLPRQLADQALRPHVATTAGPRPGSAGSSTSPSAWPDRSAAAPAGPRP